MRVVVHPGTPKTGASAVQRALRVSGNSSLPDQGAARELVGGAGAARSPQVTRRPPGPTARLVLHVGMPKTGSTAIQAAFHGFSDPTAEYLEAAGVNHYGTLLLLYGTGDESHHVFLPGGSLTIEERRAAARRRLDAQLARVASDGRALIVSSEALWTAARAHLRQAAVADARRLGMRVEGVAYLRAPLSYAVSAFQQRLKHFALPPSFGLEATWPRYRPHLASLDGTFGAAVHLRPFLATEPGFDVVSDFAALLGVAAPAGPRQRRNRSLTAEAVAVLYAQRRRHPRVAFSTRAQHRDGMGLFALLDGLGTHKLAFDEPLWAGLARSGATDLAWTEARLGRRLEDGLDPGSLVIRSERDLLDLAEAQKEQAQAFSAGLDRLVRDARGA